MCDPGTLLVVAAAAATAVQQQQASNYENDYQKMVYGETQVQANSAALSQYAQLRQREYQEGAKAAEDIRSVTSQARAARAASTLQAAETGTAGGSVDALLRDFHRNELMSKGVVVSNLQATRLQIRAEERGVAAERQQRILSAMPRPSQGPLDSTIGILATGLSLASTGFSAHQDYKSSQKAGATGGGVG